MSKPSGGESSPGEATLKAGLQTGSRAPLADDDPTPDARMSGKEDDQAHDGRAEGRNQHCPAADIERLPNPLILVVGDRTG